MRDGYEQLRNIQEAIERILKYTSHGRDSFDHDELVQTWVVHHLEIIDEAARSIPQNFKNLHPEVPWRQINSMRNILVHHYFGINQDRIWSVVEHDLPDLKVSVDGILSEQEGPTNEAPI